MKAVRQILIIATGTCLGHIFFIMLTYIMIIVLGLSLYSFFSPGSRISPIRITHPTNNPCQPIMGIVSNICTPTP